MPLPDQQVVTSRPAPRVAYRTWVLTYSPVGSGRCGDCTLVTVEGACRGPNSVVPNEVELMTIER